MSCGKKLCVETGGAAGSVGEEAGLVSWIAMTRNRERKVGGTGEEGHEKTAKGHCMSKVGGSRQGTEESRDRRSQIYVFGSVVSGRHVACPSPEWDGQYSFESPLTGNVPQR